MKIDESIVQQREYKYNNSLLIVKVGDIAETNTDVLVNSDDYSFPMKDGLSKYILERGGDELKNDLLKNKSAKLGDVVVSTAGKLPHKYIFHCVTVPKDKQFINDGSESQEKIRAEMEQNVIRNAISKCFRLLSTLDLRSIAIPCIGVRRAGFSLVRIGRIMSEVISDFLLKTNKEYRVELCLWNIPEQYGLMDYISFVEQFAIRASSDSGIAPSKESENRPINHQNISKDKQLTCDHDVFISYSHQDTEIARRVCSLLDKHKITYWIDNQGIRQGDDFKNDIVEAIQRSNILLFLSTRNSNKSRNTIKEVSIAEYNNKAILPVKFDDSPYDKSLEYDLCNLHWIQLGDNKDYDELGRQLSESIRYHKNRNS